MRRLFLICIVLPNFCFASIDVRMLYINAVADFSTCGNALMPWGGKGWQPDEVEQPYVLQAKLNRSKMQSEIDERFYTEANLEKLFVASISTLFPLFEVDTISASGPSFFTTSSIAVALSDARNLYVVIFFSHFNYHQDPPSIVATTFTFLLSGNSVNDRTIKSSTCCRIIPEICLRIFGETTSTAVFPSDTSF